MLSTNVMKMKKKRVIVLAMQIILTLVSILLVHNYVNNKISPIDAYVYNSNFTNSDSVIEASDITKVKVPSEAVSKKFALNEEDIIGKHVDGTVKQGQYIYKDQLIEKEEIDIFEHMDLEKLRKISLPISYQEAFAGEIKAGDTIDLLYVGQGQQDSDEDMNGGGNFTYSKVFMSDVLVYSVDSNKGKKYESSKQRNPDMEEEEGEEQKEEELGIVTLAVNLDEAEQIQARLSTGNVKFIGRFDDSKSYDTLGYVMGEYGKVFSGKAFAETDELEIIEDEFDEINIEEKQKEDKEDKEDRKDKAKDKNK